MWLKRQIISYIPIFLIVTLFLTFIAFLSMSEMSKQASGQINEAATVQLLQVIDYALQDIEKLAIKEMDDNSKLIHFFYADSNEIRAESDAAEAIQSWMVNNPLIHSVYLYRKSDHIVLNNSFRTTLSMDADAPFLISQSQGQLDHSWSDPRSYTGSSFQGRTERVVSMVKKFPFVSGELGFLVINVKIAALEAMINQDTGSRVNFIKLLDRTGKPFHEQPTEDNKKVLAQIKSSYTGWTIQSGIGSIGILDFSGEYLVISAMLGVISILLGTLWMLYVTQRNYKPIGTILDRINSVQKLKNCPMNKEEFHELKIIETALESLISQSMDYEKVHEEDLVYRRQVFFHDVLEGNRMMTQEQWEQELARLQLPGRLSCFQVVLVDIDKFTRFKSAYSLRDQDLLKFSLGYVAREMAGAEKFTIWVEWLGNKQLGILFLRDEQSEELHSIRLIEFCERLQSWVQHHLKFTVTIGIGNAVAAPEQISLSYEQALEALDCKLISGTNKVISYCKADPAMGAKPLHDYLPEIRNAARIYRMGETGWRTLLEELFASIREGSLVRDEITTLISILLNTFYREMAELPGEYQSMWKSTAADKLNPIFTEYETIKEFQRLFVEVLYEFDGKMRMLRESRQYASVVEQVRTYIHTHYENPDLSLAHLGDVVETSPKYLSHIFKEQLGVKFVDYLALVRMEHAKRLLLSTNDPIPDIALQVGYVHAVSFNRVFKKITGVTPGGFRNGSEHTAGIPGLKLEISSAENGI